MIADLRQGKLDWIDQVPFNAVNAVKKSKGVKVNEWPGARDHEHHVELEPAQAQEPRAARPAGEEGALDVRRPRQDDPGRLRGYATKVESLVGHISPLENPNLGPTKYNCAAANKALDTLGYKRGSDGIRVAPATSGKYAQGAHPMSYEIVTPTSTDFNVNRMFEIVKEGFAKLGVKATQKVGGDSTATLRARDGREVRRREEHRLLEVRHRDVGLDRRSRPGLPALGRDEGPVVLVERHRLGQPGLRQALREAGRDGRTRRSGGRSSTRCRRWSTTPSCYTQLTNHVALDATSTKWTGFKNQLNAYSKTYYTSPKKR